ncbi:MAG: PhzF family phenazine biosynthesis protein [Oculatellaceae cyanobacterium Prado106]|nr:PhzF family phenazine biosynthesis protein [Oculatellaceae cyanobacterium Prado106]
MNLNIFQVDAFTDQPFAGNPAAVCFLTEAQPDGWMQNVAREMNLSETAFLLPEQEGFRLRWFTPIREVDLCGHATLASAHILWTEGYLPPETPARFYTRSGSLTATYQTTCQNAWIELSFPAIAPTKAIPPIFLAQALGIPIQQVYESSLGYLVELDSEITLRQLQPDFTLLRLVHFHSVTVTSRAHDDERDYDFVSRYFAPNFGVDEDPVTGSAHCCLAIYWRDRLSKTEFTAYQASARGGTLKVRCEGDRVFLGGQAVTVWKGIWLVG